MTVLDETSALAVSDDLAALVAAKSGRRSPAVVASVHGPGNRQALRTAAAHTDADIVVRLGRDAIGEADPGERIHRNRPLAELRPHADHILTAVLDRNEVAQPSGGSS